MANGVELYYVFQLYSVFSLKGFLWQVHSTPHPTVSQTMSQEEVGSLFFWAGELRRNLYPNNRYVVEKITSPEMLSHQARRGEGRVQQ